MSKLTSKLNEINHTSEKNRDFVILDLSSTLLQRLHGETNFNCTNNSCYGSATSMDNATCRNNSCYCTSEMTNTSCTNISCTP